MAVARSTADAHAGQLGDGAVFRALYRHLEGHGVPLHPYDRAWDDLRRLRADYLPYLRATITLFLVPPEFRNHAAPLPLRSPDR